MTKHAAVMSRRNDDKKSAPAPAAAGVSSYMLRSTKLTKTNLWSMFFLFVLMVLATFAFHGMTLSTDSGSSTSVAFSHRRLLDESFSGKSAKVDVFLIADESSLSTQKNIQDLQNALKTASSSSVTINQIHIVSTLEEQKSFVESACSDAISGTTAAQRFQQLVDANQEHLASEIYKYCALRIGSKRNRLWLDAASPLLLNLVPVLEQIIAQSSTKTQILPNIAILGGSGGANQKGTIHGSLLFLTANQANHIANEMLSALVTASMDLLLYKPLFLPQTLHDLIESQVKDTLRPGPNGGMTTLDGGGDGSWYLLELECLSMAQSSMDSNSVRLSCPLAHGGYCCRVLFQSETMLLTRHMVSPLQQPASSNGLAKPYNAETMHYSEEDLPYIATVREKVFPKPEDVLETKNYFDILLSNQCLPDSVDCARCLRSKNGANCDICAKECKCYCKVLCVEHPEPKHVSKHIEVFPPKYARYPNRLVPRIVHQTYYEDLTQDKYPNMSRMVESFKHSGWDYRFYSDEEAQNFLSTHFPPEVREAYDTLRPGAFKADLFRYCALLIHGGVYADVDIILESNLDFSIPPDAGFVVPVDEPGSEANVPMCVWNGFIAAAPAHPFLAKVIETVVNQVRNRFTSVDVDATFCPDPELSVLHAFDTLFTAGPCALGAAMNRVLGRPGQATFAAGELSLTASATVASMPGRSIVLHQNKWDMGGHRFTLVEQNMVVAATDLPDSDDREAVPSTAKTEHYSKTHASIGIYGLEHLYTDRHVADENLEVVVVQDAWEQPLNAASEG